MTEWRKMSLDMHLAVLPVLLAKYPDYWNAKQVFNAMILWHKTQNKKMMRKQRFSMSYMKIERQSRGNDLLMERVAQPLYWRKSLHIVASKTSVNNPNPYPCILTSSSFFQPNVQVSTCCPNDAAICKSVERSHPGLNEETFPTPLGNWKVHRRSPSL